MPEQRPQPNNEEFGIGGAPLRPGRRAGDRHYLAVVATEARRLARELRAPRAAGQPVAPQPRAGGSH